MTPQQERLAQARCHRFWAATWQAAGRGHSKPGDRSRRLAKYYRRTATQNKQAHKRHAS